MNFLLNLNPDQWAEIQTLSQDLDTDPAMIIFRLLELGYPVLKRQTRLKPRRRPKLRLVRS